MLFVLYSSALLFYFQLVVIGTYLIASCFFSVYSMAVDTLFLCFCKYGSNFFMYSVFVVTVLIKILLQIVHSLIFELH